MANRILRPLSSSTYLRRNLTKTAPLVAVIMLAVMLVNCIIALVDSIPLSIRINYGYAKEFLSVGPRGNPLKGPGLYRIVETESPVPIERKVILRLSRTQIHSIVGKWPFAVLGLSQEDMRYFVGRQRGSTIEGRYPEPGKPEAIISRKIAQNLKLKLGSTVLKPTDSDAYSPYPVRVVGIVETDRWFILDPIEYQRSNHFPPVDLAIFFAKNQADQRVLGHWAKKRLEKEGAEVFAYEQLEKDANDMFKTLFAILNIVIGLIVGVITLMVAMLINIYQSQRLLEFGLLQALGYTKKRLLTRSVVEVAIVVVVGYVGGLILGNLVLGLVDGAVMQPNAYALDKYDAQALRYTIPVPITILLAAAFTVYLRFRKFDPVGVVERRLV